MKAWYDGTKCWRCQLVMPTCWFWNGCLVINSPRYQRKLVTLRVGIGFFFVRDLSKLEIFTPKFELPRPWVRSWNPVDRSTPFASSDVFFFGFWDLEEITGLTGMGSKISPTPWKMNMEPENHQFFLKRKIIFQSFIFGFPYECWGV